MSDKIYILAENASPAARIQSPFGAIATDVSGSVSAEAVMKNAGLNWRVSKEELFLADKTKITDHVAIRRDDTKGVLGVVGSGYEPLQNVEAFAFADNLVSQGAMEYVGAGMFEDGKRIFIQAKLNRPDVDGEGGIGLAEVVPGDAIQPYFFFANGHDGGLSVHVQMVNIRVVCGNTFAMAIEQGKKTKNRRAGTAVTLRHTKNVSERLEETQEMLKWAGLEFTKFIGAAIPFEGEPWEILSKHAPVTTAVPLAAVLTLPATGSESNSFAVISRAETGQKLAFSSTFGYPVFSVLDPEVTYSLPPRQVANGVVDAFVHTIEQYLTFPVGARLQDRFAESILQTLIEVGPQTLARPTDYDLRANFVWAATMALNGLIGQGVPQDWSTHMIGHELTALYGIDHARTLACVLPDLLRVQSKNKAEKLLQYAERIWGVREGSPEQRMEAGIAATEKFFESLGVPTRLKAYGQVKADTPDIVAHRLTANGMTGLGERQEVTPEAVEKILELSLA